MQISKFVTNIIDFIFPPKCYICKTTVANKGLCTNCIGKLQTPKCVCQMCGIAVSVHNTICVSCSRQKKSFHTLHFAYIYNEAIYDLISQFKYWDNLILQNFLVRILKTSINADILGKVDVVIPVPMHYFKLIKRRYNHTILLGKQFANENNLYFNPFILKKHRNTKAQMTLSGEARLNNLKNSFMINSKFKSSLQDKTILLIDDVVTTGATIDSCCKVLKEAGAKQIHVLVIARVRGVLKV